MWQRSETIHSFGLLPRMAEAKWSDIDRYAIGDHIIFGLTGRRDRLHWRRKGDRGIEQKPEKRGLRDHVERIVPWYRAIGYLIATLAVLFAATIRFGLEPWLSGRALYLAFMVAVFVAAVFGGPMPAIFAVALSIICVHLLRGISPNPHTAVIELAVFVCASAVVIWLVHLIMKLRGQSALDEGKARRREEDAIRLAEERALLLDGISGHGLIMLDGEGRVRIWSKGAEALLGWSADEAMEEPWAFAYPAAAVRAGGPAADLDRARGEGRFAGTATLLGKDGRPVTAALSLSALHDVRGRFRGYAIMLKG